MWKVGFLCFSSCVMCSSCVHHKFSIPKDIVNAVLQYICFSPYYNHFISVLLSAVLCTLYYISNYKKKFHGQVTTLRINLCPMLGKGSKSTIDCSALRRVSGLLEA